MKASVNECKPSRAGTLPFAAGAAGIAVLLLRYYKLTWDNLTRFNLAIDICADPFPDFTRYYYPMGEAIFRTRMPVEGIVYSPFVAILLAAYLLLLPRVLRGGLRPEPEQLAGRILPSFERTLK